MKIGINIMELTIITTLYFFPWVNFTNTATGRIYEVEAT
jgi:hypothetical protein